VPWLSIAFLEVLEMSVNSVARRPMALPGISSAYVFQAALEVFFDVDSQVAEATINRRLEERDRVGKALHRLLRSWGQGLVSDKQPQPTPPGLECKAQGRRETRADLPQWPGEGVVDLSAALHREACLFLLRQEGAHSSCCATRSTYDGGSFLGTGVSEPDRPA
jgi:hypothetical protein